MVVFVVVEKMLVVVIVTVFIARAVVISSTLGTFLDEAEGSWTLVAVIGLFTVFVFLLVVVLIGLAVSPSSENVAGVLLLRVRVVSSGWVPLRRIATHVLWWARLIVVRVPSVELADLVDAVISHHRVWVHS